MASTDPTRGGRTVKAPQSSEWSSAAAPRFGDGIYRKRSHRGLRRSAIGAAGTLMTAGVLVAACVAGPSRFPFGWRALEVPEQDVLGFPADIGVKALAAKGGSVWALGIKQKGPDRRRAWLYRVDPATMTFVGTPLAVGTADRDMVYACPYCTVAVGEGAIWVAYPGGFWRVDPLSERRLAEIRVPTRSIWVGEGAVWAVSANAVHSIDPRTAEVIATIPVASASQVAGGGGAVWVTTRDGLVRIDPELKRIRTTVPVGGAWGLGVGHGAVWVAHGVIHHELTRVDPLTNRTEASIFLCHGGSGGCGHDLTVVIGPHAVWVGRTRLLFRIDPATNQVIDRVDTTPSQFFGRWWFADAVAPAEGVVWIAQDRSGWGPSSLVRWRVP